MNTLLPNEVEVHYYLPTGMHSADAYLIAKAEIEFISLIKDIAEQLGVSLRLETEARTEGGIRQTWKAFGRNSGQVGCILALIAILVELRPQSDKDLIRLQKEESRLHIEYLKQQLNKDSDAIETNSIQNAASDLNGDLRVVRRRSNFYDAIHHEHRIESVSFTFLDNGQHLPNVVHIKRDAFIEFIALSGVLPVEIDDDANISIISPVLKKGRYKWKGIYNDQIIDFHVRDRHFKESVLQKVVDFRNGTSINCILHKRIKVDEVGVLSPAGYYVILVKKVFDDEKSNITEQGKAHYARKQFEEDQFKLI